MCGVCGFIGVAPDGVLVRMNQTMVHRGPDDEGYHHDGQVHLAMRRLSIVDLDSGRQPLSNEDETIWTVFNGEIYDHLSLRRELTKLGHAFRTDHSDTEVIPHLYEEHGEHWANHVNGMFAVAIWDSSRQRLSLYRDRVGQKPLYYALADGGIVFGSEIKAVLAHPAVSRELDYGALYHYFGLKNLSAPRTAYRDVRQLLPGQVLTWQEGRVATQCYWSPDFSPLPSEITEEEARQKLLELLDDAVRLRMQCDVSYGAYLSGGVDSSSVVSLMRRYQPAGLVLKTFCLGYQDPPDRQFVGKHRDIGFARIMAERLATEHYEHMMTAADFARMLPTVLKAFDEPFSGTVSTFFLSELIHRHVKVALSGDGADELFGSYLAHRLAFPIERFCALARAGKTRLEDLTPAERRSLAPFDVPDQFAFLARVASPRLAQWRRRLSVFSDTERHELLTEDFLAEAGRRPQSDIYAALEPKLTGRDILNRSLEIDQRELLGNQVLPFVDRLSMAHSVEIRCPYLDYRIIEFANRLPGSLKIRDGVNKYIHKKAMEMLLPSDLLARPKEGFVQPIYSWMHGSLREWTTERLRLLPCRLFRMDRVDKLVRRLVAGDQSVNAKVWNLACFATWYNEAYQS